MASHFVFARGLKVFELWVRIRSLAGFVAYPELGVWDLGVGLWSLRAGAVMCKHCAGCNVIM